MHSRVLSAATVTLVLPMLIPAAQTATLNLPSLAGKTVRCGIHDILYDCPPPLGFDGSSPCSYYGSAFANIVNISDNVALLRSIAVAPYGTLVQLPLSQVEGTVVNTIRTVGTLSGLNVELYAMRLPPAMVAFPNTAVPSYFGTNTVGLDCMVSAGALTYTTDRQHLLRYSYPFGGISGGLAVVTNRPKYEHDTLVETVFLLFRPFTPLLWGVVMLSVLFSSGMIMWLENDHIQSEFHGTRIEQSLFAVYLSFVAFTGHSFFAPETRSAKLYTTGIAFSMFFVIALYVARLHVFFTLKPIAVQPIKSFSDFPTLGVPVCIQNKSIIIGFMSGFYPSYPVKIIDTLSVPVLFQQVQSGACMGALVSAADASFFLGKVGDPTKSFCDIEFVGGFVNRDAGSLSVVWTMNNTQLPQSLISNIDMYIAQAQYDGLITAYEPSQIPFGDYARPQCAAQEYEQKELTSHGLNHHQSYPLSVAQMAGAFIVQGAALVVAVMVRVSQKRVKKHVNTLSIKLANLVSKAEKSINNSVIPEEDENGKKSAAASSEPWRSRDNPISPSGSGGGSVAQVLITSTGGGARPSVTGAGMDGKLMEDVMVSVQTLYARLAKEAQARGQQMDDLRRTDPPASIPE